VVGLGQAEAADPLAGRQLGQIFLFLRLGAEFEDRHHDQRGLHAHHRAVAGVDPLNLAGDQAVGHVVQARTAVLLRNRRAEQAEFAHLAEDRHVGRAIAKRFGDPRQQLVLTVSLGGFAHHALVVAELGLQQERVLPIECRVGHAGSPRM